MILLTSQATIQVLWTYMEERATTKFVGATAQTIYLETREMTYWMEEAVTTSCGEATEMTTFVEEQITPARLGPMSSEVEGAMTSSMEVLEIVLLEETLGQTMTRNTSTETRATTSYGAPPTFQSSISGVAKEMTSSDQES